MTLSHCWGSIEILRLQDSNLKTLCESIPLVRLPKTFRHAMKVTKCLGVRYLWIDSLCIIQDSETDWLREAGSMYHVYQNSYCNIAATGAANGEQGCFFSRNPNAVSATKVQPAWEDVTSETYVVVQPLHHCKSRFLDSPLLRRAWVVQERLLAHRTLHFTREQIFWECRTLMACEIYTGGIRTAPECGGHHTNIGGDDLYIHRAPDSQEETNRGLPKEAIAWNRIVDLYTRCDLTRASDKLIALSGIASEFHRTRLSADDQYLAGLWKSQLPNALLWQGATTTCSRPREYRAPSWSWASIDGPVSMRATERQLGHWYHIFTEVLVAETTTAGNNPTGKVTEGYLHLLVLFANATWEKGKYRMELVEVSKPGGKSLDMRSCSSMRLHGGMKFDTDTNCEKVIKTPIVCMEYNAPIEGTRHSHGWAPCLYGFVLEDSGEGTFRRIGTWDASSSSTALTSSVHELLPYFAHKIISLV
jgi:Heterokaryon incompatibility protein (HET)